MTILVMALCVSVLLNIGLTVALILSCKSSNKKEDQLRIHRILGH